MAVTRNKFEDTPSAKGLRGAVLTGERIAEPETQAPSPPSYTVRFDGTAVSSFGVGFDRADVDTIMHAADEICVAGNLRKPFDCKIAKVRREARVTLEGVGKNLKRALLKAGNDGSADISDQGLGLRFLLTLQENDINDEVVEEVPLGTVAEISTRSRLPKPTGTTLEQTENAGRAEFEILPANREQILLLVGTLPPADCEAVLEELNICYGREPGSKPTPFEILEADLDKTGRLKDPLGKLRELVEAIRAEQGPHLAAFETILQKAGGVKLGSVAEQRQFKDLVNELLDRFRVGLRAPTGDRARLTVAPNRNAHTGTFGFGVSGRGTKGGTKGIPEKIQVIP